MFSYHLPEGLKSNTYYNADGQIKFDPPVYEQRYSTALRILADPCWNTTFKKVVDFGCAEMRLLPLLRRVDNVEHILEVDIDEQLLLTYQHRAVPLVSDYLQKREIPLRVEIFRGSIDASVDCLKRIDAVIALEIIEHLYPDVLDNIPKNVFGYMQPKLAIFSTPNSEFNVLFEPLLENGFRHLDHKFEWTRKEFKDWAMNIIKQYPNYNVAIMGVGKAPPERKKLGYVTQIAIFARLDVLGKELLEPIKENLPPDNCSEVQYREIYAVDFPFQRDERKKPEKILDELRYHIDRCRRIDRYYNREREIYQVPLDVLLGYVVVLGGTDEEMRMILLENNFEIDGDFVVLPEYDEGGNYDEDDDDNRRFPYDNTYDDVVYGDELDGAVGGATGNTYKVKYDSDENWD